MTFTSAPAWLQLLIVVEAGALAWLTYRFGWRGLGWGLVAGAASWFALGYGGTFLVSRLEGATLPGMMELAGTSAMATGRLAVTAGPLLALAAGCGALLRWRLRPRRRKAW